MQTTGEKEEVSLYFHIPFCKKKCPFCHFFVVSNQGMEEGSFLKALRTEWERSSALLQNKRIVSIYFGGGTPSQLPPSSYAEILSWIQLKSDLEITLEANPEDITPHLLKDYRSLGINRLSIGVQSFDDGLLQQIQRGHSGLEAKKAIFTAAEAGFSNISIDLLYELPHQTLEVFEESLNEVQDLPLSHLSLYNLVLEPGSAFFRQKNRILPLLPSQQSAFAMHQLALSKLHSAGFEQYEISAFAKNGAFSYHNVGYWEGRSFLGFGPSAFSYWEGKRTRNIANLSQYKERLAKDLSPIDFTEELSLEERQKELFAIQLRLFRGVNIDLFTAKHTELTRGLQESLERLEKRGWIERSHPYYRLTDQGRLFYDSVGEELI